jgi:hypothetical protein
VSKPNGRGRTLKDLREAAETLGYESKEQVQSILESGGLGGNFKSSLWTDYLSLLVVHAQTAEQLLWRVRDEERGVRSDPCPVCGSDTYWLYGADSLGSPSSWSCSVGGTAHYGWVQANHVRESIGLPPIDYKVLEQLKADGEKRNEVLQRLYWKAVLGRLTEEEQAEFEEVYGNGT